MYFRSARNIELSTIYFMEQSVASDWSGVTVIKNFKDAYSKDIKVPIICIGLEETSTTRLEIGNTRLENRYIVAIDIFARSDAQRLDLADYITDKLKDGWVSYSHSHASGDKETLVRTANGKIFVTNFVSDGVLDFGPNTDEKDRYRHSIVIQVRKSI